MTDVLVVGAGPTGLMMAIELIRRGLSVRIIDQAIQPSDKSKAIAIQARTLEIFDQIGLIDRFLEKGLQIKATNIVSQKEVLAHVLFQALDSPFPFILSVPQYDTELILTEHLKSLGTEVERGVELQSFEQKGEGVTATCTTGKEAYSWMIGCDGAHSTTRKALGFSFEGKTFAKYFSLADVQVEWNHPHDEFFLFLNEDGILAVVPLPENNRYRVIFQGEPTMDKVKGLIEAHADPKAVVSDPRWLTEFHINSRITEKYFKGRVFLAGDAAHIHSPAGGQGMNTGFADAYNLAWKLSLVHRKIASPEILKTFDLERRRFGKQLLFATERATNLAMLKNPFLVWLRNTILRWLGKKDAFQKQITKLLSQIAVRYDRNRMVGPGGGTRAPNANTDSGDLYTFMRGYTGFILMSNKENLVLPECQNLTHDGSVYDSELFYVIRPDSMIGCVSKDQDAVHDYFSNIFPSQG